MGNEQSSGGHGSTEGSQSGLLKGGIISEFFFNPQKTEPNHCCPITFFEKMRNSDLVQIFWGLDQIENTFWDYPAFKDCVIDADPILNDQHWSLHHAQLHSTPMSVFISKDKNGSLDELAKVVAIHISYRLLFVRSTYFVTN